ncbi:jg15578 [Pararge aegeria aegeria]|uniref:Jg15578 protein n=1 Tax=Pararge aegeria aegeria TaxID=348720 RepID=A0A8S4RVY4_9NEOP|nr:jg15578 [Pararge aegeria aegeria]
MFRLVWYTSTQKGHSNEQTKTLSRLFAFFDDFPKRSGEIAVLAMLSAATTAPTPDPSPVPPPAPIVVSYHHAPIFHTPLFHTPILHTPILHTPLHHAPIAHVSTWYHHPILTHYHFPFLWKK